MVPTTVLKTWTYPASGIGTTSDFIQVVNTAYVFPDYDEAHYAISFEGGIDGGNYYAINDYTSGGFSETLNGSMIVQHGHPVHGV